MSQAGPSQIGKKRKTSEAVLRKSIYTLPPRYTTQSLKSNFRDRKGKGRARVETEDLGSDGVGNVLGGFLGDDWGEEVPETQTFDLRERALRGWKTRRIREKFSRWDLNPSPEDTTPLPDDDLLHAIHQYAADFYLAQDLLIPPRRAPRAIKHQWPSKKRRIIQNHYSNLVLGPRLTTPEEFAAPPGGEISPSPLRERLRSRKEGDPGWIVMSGDEARGGSSSEDDGSVFVDEDHEEQEQEEEEEDDVSVDEQYEGKGQSGESERGERDNSQTVNDSSEEEDDMEDRVGADTWRVGPDEDGERGETNQPIEAKRKHRSHKGNYKRRDMYKALNGSVLLAIGVLVEQHIHHHLSRSGFAPAPTSPSTVPPARTPVDPPHTPRPQASEEDSQSASPSSQTSTPPPRHRKHRKRQQHNVLSDSSGD